MKKIKNSNIEMLRKMARQAWIARDNAYLYGKTKVGATAVAMDNSFYTGCNIEHRFRSHDIHAEINAISTMIAAGRQKMTAIIIVAKRKRFLPCGSCMDWIIQFGGPKCLVAYQYAKNGKITVFTASNLMPYYPK